MNVTFVGPGGTPLGTFNMDVPRTGDQVAVAGQGFTVAAVRFYTSPPLSRGIANASYVRDF